jgi:hypothetical protein
MTNDHWKFCGASVRGTGHVQTGTPCQDSFGISRSTDGKWIALVASDGAGTASRSKEGSQLVAKSFAGDLIKLASELDSKPPGAWVTDRVIEAIVHTRHELRRVAGCDDISPFHCTLVSALLGPSGGFSIHLGDGAVFGGTLSPIEKNTIDLGDDFFVSEPENGEYANETVFLTERDWIKKLRIHPIGRVDWVMLGTDGGMALAMIGEKLPKSGFVLPVLSNLCRSKDQDTADSTLVEALSDPKADRLTNDDKTLTIAIRREIQQVQGEFSSVTKTIKSGLTKPEIVDTAKASGLTAPNKATASELNQSSVLIKKKWTENTGQLLLLGLSAILVVIAIGAGIWLMKIGAKDHLFVEPSRPEELHSTKEPKTVVIGTGIPLITASAPALPASEDISITNKSSAKTEVLENKGQQKP